jgi:hypothetical protein
VIPISVKNGPFKKEGHIVVTLLWFASLSDRSPSHSYLVVVS